MAGKAQSNVTGKGLERHIEAVVAARGYAPVTTAELDRVWRDQIPAARYTSQHAALSRNIYGSEHIVDAVLYHPRKWPHRLAIEAKSQGVAGSVDNKFPYLVQCIALYPCPTIIVYEGEGARPEAIAWLRERAAGHPHGYPNLVAVLSRDEFDAWAQQNL